MLNIFKIWIISWKGEKFGEFEIKIVKILKMKIDVICRKGEKK